jgi:hypothetical protein
MAGTAGTPGDAGLGRWTDSIVNAGRIIDAVAADTLALVSSFFTNTGTLAIGTSSMVQMSLYDFFAAPNAGFSIPNNSGTIAMGGGILHEMTAGGTTPAGDVLIGSSATMSGLDVCNWSNASSLDITDIAPAAAKLTSTITNGVTHLTLSNGMHTVNMTIGASLASSGFTPAANGHGGTVIAYHG